MAYTFEALTQDLARLIGLDSLSPDEHGEVVLQVDEHIVTLRAIADTQLMIYASVGVLPATKKEALLSRLLLANYFFSGTRGATLGADPATGDIKLQCLTPFQGLDISLLTGLLENFLADLEHWSAKCAQDPENGEQSAPPAEPGGLRC